jgi:hypothetical protein
MFFLNLSFGEFITLLGAIGGIVTALYLLDRSRRKKVVSTLRFWVNAPRVEEHQRRKRIRDPWSLILQLASLLLLLLAIAQLQWGSRDRAGRNHVIILDTSTSMAQRDGNGILLDSAKQKARDYLASVPKRDSLMLIRADGIATPVVGFTTDRKQLLRAISESTPSYSALSLASALELGHSALRWSEAGRGYLAFAGGTRVARWDDESVSVPNLRFLPVGHDSENAGIRRVTVKRVSGRPDLWHASIGVNNYGTQPRRLNVRVRFASTLFAPRAVVLGPAEEQILDYKFSTTGPGTLSAWIEPGDQLSIDDNVAVQLPAPTRLRIALYSDRASAWQPLLEASSEWQTVFLPKSSYVPKPNADIVLLDDFAPPDEPQLPSLWITPPRDASPIPVAGTRSGGVLNHWYTETELGTGLRSKELLLASAELFEQSSRNIDVAAVDGTPVIVARPAQSDRPRLAVVGFDPMADSMRYEIATPLLFANLLRWLGPENLRTDQFGATAVGNVLVPLGANESRDNCRVLDEHGFALPFTTRAGMLQVYVSRPETIRVISPGREQVFSVTLPGVGAYRWQPPPQIPREIPRATWFIHSAIDLWKWLAIFGGIGLFAEWIFFGKQRPVLWKRSVHREHREQAQDELVRQ